MYAGLSVYMFVCMYVLYICVACIVLYVYVSWFSIRYCLTHSLSLAIFYSLFSQAVDLHPDPALCVAVFMSLSTGL